MILPVNRWLLWLLLVMVGHAGKSWGADRKENILLVLWLGLWLGLRLDLMLRRAVRRAVCRRTIGRLLMLIHWRPRRGPGRWLWTLRGRGSNIQGGVATTRVVPRGDLQSLWDIGYTLRQCDCYRVHGVTSDWRISGRHALHCWWRCRSASRAALVVHEERIVTWRGGHCGRGRQRFRVAGPLWFNVTVTGAVH